MVSFGVLLPQDGKTYREVAETAKTAEHLGFESLWLFDHFMPFMLDKKKDYLEGWTTIAALAAETHLLRLGLLVSCASYRNPALLAKMAATLDVLSDGRLEFGIGAGWYSQEYDAYGIPFPKAGVRVDQLREAIRIIKGMWTESPFTYEGRYYRVKDSVSSPMPKQRPHPPIVIGGSRPRMLRLMAEEADIANLGITPFGLKKTAARLDRICKEVGREPSSLVKSYVGLCMVWKSRLSILLSPLNLDLLIAGSPMRCADKIDRLVVQGFTYFILYFIGRDRAKVMKTFAEEVIPCF